MRTPLKAIRAKCLDCSNGSFAEVKECPILTCPLYPYRFGHNPNRAGIGKASSLAKSETTQSDTSSENDEWKDKFTTSDNSDETRD